MATIIWPPEASKITYNSPRLVYPGQVELESLYGVGSQAIGRAPGHWVGTVDIGQTNTGTPIAKAISAFIAKLRGIANTVDIPIHEPSVGGIATGTVISVEGTPVISGGRTSVSTDYAHATALLDEGDYVRIGRRLYILAEDMTPAGVLTLEPAVLPVAGETNVIWEDVSVHARVLGAIDEWRRTPEFTGPWSFAYREVPK